MLNSLKLKNDMKKAFARARSKTDNPDEAIDTLCTELTAAIDSYVKTATIIATPAQVTAAAMANAGGPVLASNNLISTIQ